jgi:hypothetical protein
MAVSRIAASAMSQDHPASTSAAADVAAGAAEGAEGAGRLSKGREGAEGHVTVHFRFTSVKIRRL